MALRQQLTSLTLSLLILCVAAGAQLPPDKKESDEEKARARKELERKALALLDETLAMEQALKLAENRAAVRAQAADLLWTRDEKRARALYRDAAAELAASLGAEGVAQTRNYWMLAQFRTQLLHGVAARDAQLALELLRESRPAAPEGADADAPAAPSGDPEAELRMEQALLAQVAESDPKAALRVAEESLGKGVTFGVLGVLERLRRKDAEAATRLALKIIERLRGQTLSGGREGFMVAGSLLQRVLLPQSPEDHLRFGAEPPPQRPGAEKPRPLVLEDAAVRELAEMVSAAALKDSTATGAFGLMALMRQLLPELEKRLPARAAQLRQRLAEMDRTLDPRRRAWSQFDSVMAKPADAILEEAARAPDELRGHFYTAAAMKLMQAGETEKARQVVNANVRGPEREQLLASIEQAEVARAVEKGATGEAREAVARIKSKGRRARALAELAAAFALKGDRKSAGQLLEEARGLVDSRPDDEKEVEALLEVARGYALVDPAKTFEIVDPLVDHANDLLTAAALLEKFGRGGDLFRKGEMLIWTGLGQMDGSFARYVKALSELARVDFERTKATADRFNRDEVRIALRLTVARSVLSDRLDAATPPGPFVGGVGVLGSN